MKRNERNENMKNRTIFAIAFILLGLFVILAPSVLFPICESEKKMACFYTKQAEIGLGVFISALGVVYFFLKNKNIRLGIAIAEFFISGLVLAYPLKLTGLCKMSDMACRVKTLPALIVVSILLILVSLVDIFFLAKSEQSE